MRHSGASRASSTVVAMASNPMTIKSPRIAIEYCTRCNWMMRSAWTAQELLTTFNGTVGEVALIPNHRGRRRQYKSPLLQPQPAWLSLKAQGAPPRPGAQPGPLGRAPSRRARPRSRCTSSGDGTFDVTLLTSEGEIVLFSRAEEGRFPENKELKNLVRDAIDPGRDLGHSEDTTGPTSRNSGTTAFDRLVSGVAEVVATNKQHAALARLVRCSSTASQRLQPHSFRR